MAFWSNPRPYLWYLIHDVTVFRSPITLLAHGLFNIFWLHHIWQNICHSLDFLQPIAFHSLLYFVIRMSDFLCCHFRRSNTITSVQIEYFQLEFSHTHYNVNWMSVDSVWWRYSCACHEGLWGSCGIAPFLNSTVDGNQWSGSCLNHFMPCKTVHSMHWIGNQMGSRASLAVKEKKKSTDPTTIEPQFLDHPFCNLVTKSTELAKLLFMWQYNFYLILRKSIYQRKHSTFYTGNLEGKKSKMVSAGTLYLQFRW